MPRMADMSAYSNGLFERNAFFEQRLSLETNSSGANYPKSDNYFKDGHQRSFNKHNRHTLRLIMVLQKLLQCFSLQLS